MTRRKAPTVEYRSKGEALVVCPCGSENVVTIEPHLLRCSTPVRSRVRCQCGRSHLVVLERRAAMRKHVDLEGSCTLPGEGLGRGVLVRNLSRTGAMLELADDVEISVGDRLLLEFDLRHVQVSHFAKPAEVRRVDGRRVGAEFAGGEHDRQYDMALALHQPGPLPHWQRS